MVTEETAKHNLTALRELESALFNPRVAIIIGVNSKGHVVVSMDSELSVKELGKILRTAAILWKGEQKHASK